MCAIGIKRALLLVLLLSVSHAQAMTLERQRAYFLGAEQALIRNDETAYRRLAVRLTDYPLYPFLEYTRLKARLDRGSEIARFLERYGETRYAGFLRRIWLKHLAQNEQWRELIDHYRPTDDAASRCNYYTALYHGGRPQEAFKGAADLWQVGHSQPEECDLLFSDWQKNASFTPEMVWRRFTLALKENNASLAQYLKRLIPDPEQPAAELWLKVHNDPREVEKCLDWDGGGRFAGRIFAHGLDRLAGSDPYLALQVFEARRSLFILDPDEEKRIEQRLGLALAFNHHELAYRQLAKVGDEESSVREWRVRAALLRRNWTETMAALDRLSEEERATPQWLYWRGRAHEALENLQDAGQSYEKAAADRGFYGFLAAEKLKRNYNLSNRPVEISTAQLEALAQRPAFAAVREFRHFERESLAKSEWWHAVGRLDREGVLTASKLAQAWGWDQVAIFTIAKAEYWDDLELRFPLTYRDQIFANAGRQQMDPAIIYGLVRQESAFDHEAHSRAGALGLMQIMPATAQTIARMLEEKWISPGVLLNPDLNLRYGTAYYKTLLERFGGNFVMAAAAYNAGPHRVERWRPVSEPLDADVWVETIPFRETRRYVAAVLAYAVIYQQRMNREPAPLADYMPAVPPSDNGGAVTEKALRLAACG